MWLLILVVDPVMWGHVDWCQWKFRYMPYNVPEISAKSGRSQFDVYKLVMVWNHWPKGDIAISVSSDGSPDKIHHQLVSQKKSDIWFLISYVFRFAVLDLYIRCRLWK